MLNNTIVLREDLGKIFADRVDKSLKQKSSPINGFIAKINEESGILDFGRIIPNSTCVGGRRFIQEKIHGKTPLSGQRYTANEHWNIERDVTLTPDEEHGRKICAFGLGTGGCGDIFSSIVPSTEEDIFLNNAMPFINIDKSKYPDLSPTEREKYRMRRVYDWNGTTYIQYWLKVITATDIKLEKGKTIYEPTAADIGQNNDGDDGILSAGKIECTTFYTLEILPHELKDYFMMIHNDSVDQCRFNEIAVFFGYDKEVVSDDGITYTELLAAEAFSHVTLENQSHKKATDLSKFIYYFSS